MRETYIKLDRSLLRHRYFDNVNVLKIWLWCLMMASHSEHTQLVGLQSVDLAPGEFVTGRDAASRDLKMPGSTAWTILKLLERDGKLDIKSNNKFSIITVIDYTSYQVERYKPQQQKQQQSDSTLTAIGQHPDTNNKGNKEKKIHLEILEFFEDLWKVYPSDGRVKKKEALRHYLATVKTDADIDRINAALQTYINHLNANEWKKPQNGSTWFNNWQDWEDHDA